MTVWIEIQYLYREIVQPKFFDKLTNTGEKQNFCVCVE